MGFTTLPLSGLRLLSPENGSSDWQTHFDYNITRLNNILLKMNALLDVNSAGIVNGSTPRWNSGTSKWIMWKPNKPLTTGTDI